MPLEVESFAPEARARYVKIGVAYSSEATLNQANQTLNALATHGPRLESAGFGPEDAEELREARDALIAAGVGRNSSKTNRKSTSEAFVAAVKTGQGVRFRGRAIALRIASVLARRADEPSKQASRHVRAELDRASAAPDDSDAEGLAAQLDGLRALFGDPVVAEAAQSRGGSAFAADAAAQASALRAVAAERTKRIGTPVESAAVDLLDGIIVDLTRSARRAARAVAKEAGDPAIAALFELTHLETSAAPGAPAAPAPAAPAPAGA